MTRDQLESIIWHFLPRMEAHAVKAVLAAADDYATCQAAAVLAGGEPVLQAHRRAVLEMAIAKPGTRKARPPAGKRELRPCGTWAAYRRHLRRCEPVDDACRKAAVAYVMTQRAARKARNAA